MDILSDVLRVVRLSGAVIFVTESSSPWAIISPAAQALAPANMPNAECFTLFHVLAEGECWVEIKGELPVKMGSGDVVVLPQGDEHVMASDLSLKPVSMRHLVPELPRPGMPPLIHGGGGKGARFVCGYLHCDQRFNYLFGSLAKLLCVHSQEGAVVVRAAGKEAPPEDAAVPLPASMWLNTTLYYLISEAESRNRTDNLMLARLVELMFVEVLRHYMQHQPADRSGWLSGLKDPHVGRALELMHAEPARNWTVEELARRAGVSRSALADRFTALIGASPMRYLTDWRIQLSKQLLSEGNLNLAEIAARVGYDSEYSFNRAFRRHVGHPPAAWHKRTATDEPRRASAAH